MKYTFDQDARIFCAGLSDGVINQAIIKIRNPAKSIHIEWVKRDSEGNHIIHIIAPNAAIWRQVKMKFLKLGGL